MNAMLTRSRLLSATLFAVLVVGCSIGDKNTSPATNPEARPLIVSMDPAAGATGVPTSTSVGIKFDMPMDSASVASCFFLSGGEPMHAWMDSLGHHHGMMGGHMVNMGHMMAWMDTLCLAGDLHWNADHDSCYFAPRAPLRPLTDHMAYLNGAVRSSHGEEMDMAQFDDGGPMLHFRTGR
jgi:hypothetical protein